MAEFRFEAVDGCAARVEYVEIPDNELIIPSQIAGDFWKDVYRNNVIERRLQNWALSKLKLSYEEVHDHESDSNRTDPGVAEQQTEKADEG